MKEDRPYVKKKTIIPQEVNLVTEKLVEITGLDVNKYVAVTMEPKIDNGKLKIPFKLVNVSGYPLYITFNSAQEYDVIIRDKNEHIIYHWADGLMFIQNIHTVVLEKDRSFDYYIDLDMNKLGRNVPGDTYTIEVQIKAALTNIYDIYNTSELITKQKLVILSILMILPISKQ